jgi:hypothetical protein
VDFVALQETKLSGLDFNFCKGIWGNDEVEFVCRDANGNSGSLLSCCWNPEVFSLTSSFDGEGFLGVVLFWKCFAVDCGNQRLFTL